MKNVMNFLENLNENEEMRKEVEAKEKEYSLNEGQTKENYKVFLEREIVPIAKKYGVSFTADEYVKFVNDNSKKLLNEDQLEEIAGGRGKVILPSVMAALTILQGPLSQSAAIHAMKPGPTQMKQGIGKNLLDAIKFRPDLSDVLKKFLPNQTNLENDTEQQNDSQSNITQSAEEKENKDQQQDAFQSHIKQIIKEDNLELLQKEYEKNKNIIIEDSLFEENMQIPILHYCVMKKAIKCFKFLILNGADLGQTLNEDAFRDEYKWDCMSLAIGLGQWEMMKILEERGIKKEINTNVWEAAALTHRNNLLKLFISNKDEINNFQECLNKALFAAVKGNNFNGLKILLSAGADINAKDEIGNTPLHHTAMINADKVAEILISQGADVNAKGKLGKTPLHIAAAINADKIAELLISKGADTNAKDVEGMTPLHETAGKEANKVAELLISKGADINAKDVYGYDPLHIVAIWNANKIAELLISKGADINAKGNDGHTPLFIARCHQAQNVMKLLEENGAVDE